MAKPAAISAGDRIRRLDTREVATFVGYHGDGGAGAGPLQVLRDQGPKTATTWGRGVAVARVAGPPKRCPRCDAAGHKAFDCPEIP